jgi:hypothetical protein
VSRVGAAKTYPPEVRLEFQERLLDDWSSLAIAVGIEPYQRRRLTKGHEASEIWDWLAVRGRLGELPGKLTMIDREDLARLLDPTLNETVEPSPGVAQWWPRLIGVLPVKADQRQDRDLDSHIAEIHRARSECLVLTGLGGVGKTQLAAALVRRRWAAEDVDLLLWVTATGRTSVVKAYKQAARVVTGIDETDSEVAARSFLSWLADPGDRSWTVVLDGVADPADLNGLWPPVSPSGRTVVTSQRKDNGLAAGRVVVNVDTFTDAEARSYLTDKLGDSDGIDDLAAALGNLPLALAQATAYIADRQIGCREYLELFKALPLDRLGPDFLPDDHLGPVAATWTLSINRADAKPPPGAARPLLDLAALLHGDRIPRQIFDCAAVLAYCGGRSGAAIGSWGVDEALQRLHRFSLVTVDRSTQTVQIHGLVQRAVYDDPGHDRSAAAVAADAICDLWSIVDTDETFEQALRDNVRVLRERADAQLWAGRVHPVLPRAGTSLGETGLTAGAVTYFTALHATAVERLGGDHPHTLDIRHELAYWQGQSGDATAAVAILTEVVDARRRVLGPDHPDTLTARHNLAAWLGESGEIEKAFAGFLTVIGDRGRILGADHVDTLTSLHNAAYWLGLHGNGAVEILEKVLEKRLAILGPDHPDTLLTRYNLAYWLSQTDPARAIEEYERLLADRDRVLGRDHPDTLLTRFDLAQCHGLSGAPAQAEVTLRKLLPEQVRVLGGEHPDTRITRQSLEYWRGAGTTPAPVKQRVASPGPIAAPHKVVMRNRDQRGDLR